MVADCLSALYLIFLNFIDSLFSLYIVDTVSLGGFLLAVAVIMYILNNFTYIAKRGYVRNDQLRQERFNRRSSSKGA